MSERNERLLAGLGRQDRLIEIGPSFNPVAPKAAGWQVTIVDHADQAALVAKYAGGAVDTSRIEPVDVIWTGGPLHEALPESTLGSFVALIACHVVEHLPDLLGFLRSAERLLDPARGALLLAVPDKRLCFDLFRPLSTTGQLIEAHRAGRARHTPRAMFDHVAYATTDAGRGGWAWQELQALRLEHTLDQAMEQMDAAETGSGYTDCHGWQFTPASFELLVFELGALGLIDWRVEWLEPCPAVEFLARLVRGREVIASPAAREARRLALLKRMVLEQGEMARRLLDPPPVTAALPADPRLCAMDARLQAVAEVQLPALAAQIGVMQEELRPVRSALDTLLPVRRAIARLRGRG